MSDRFGWLRWRPSPATLIAGGAVLLGFVLAQWCHWGFIALIGLGTFGPGMLRELGWLDDQDEFQRRAAHRAGYHAFIVTGLAAFLIYAYTRSGGILREPEELSLVYVALLWFTWMFSSLFTYWGPHKTAFRVLITFGCVWGVFVVASHITEPATVLMESLIVVPFFLFAYLSRRWPRAAGGLLIAVSLFLLGYYFHPGHFGWVDVLTKMITAIFFAGPLLASGVALLKPREERRARAEEAA